MAYTTSQAVEALNEYMGCDEALKQYIEGTKERGFVLSLKTGEQIVIFVYPLVHKQDNTKNYFDTRDSGAYERGVAWRYALEHGLKLFSGCEDTTKYSAVCDSFDEIGIQIFGEDFEEVYYNPQKG